jgi:pyruvate,water dikinase
MFLVQTLARIRLRAPVDSLEKVLQAFTAIYEPLFGVVQPVARAARTALVDFLRRHGIDAATRLPALLAGVPSAARDRAELARAFSDAPDPAAQAETRAVYLDRFGDESARWDVAEPTWSETPLHLDRRLRGLGAGVSQPAPDAWRAVAQELRATLPEAERATWDRLLDDARASAAVAEDDDALYARAQAHVRHALHFEGVRLAADGLLGTPAHIFWLPLDLVRAVARGERTTTREETAQLVKEARRADAAARAAPPSLTGADLSSGIVRGRGGAGGVCVGRVHLWSGADPAPRDEILVDPDPKVIVARTILPTELPLISAAALVVETGGPLDHVAAQARERGIPAVVGAAGATSTFREGDRVIVDGDAAVVARLD